MTRINNELTQHKEKILILEGELEAMRNLVGIEQKLLEA